MLAPVPSIARFVTRCLLSVTPEATMAEAYQLMRDNDVRHLPVLRGTEPVGMVSLRDLHLMQTLPDVRVDEVPVEDAMETDLYIVGPDTRIDVVAEQMADRKLGSALVVKEGDLFGLFTTTDALRALGELARAGAERTP